MLQDKSEQEKEMKQLLERKQQEVQRQSHREKQQQYNQDMQHRQQELIQKKILEHVHEHPKSPLATLVNSASSVGEDNNHENIETNPSAVASATATAALNTSIDFVSSIFSKISTAIYGQAWMGRHLVPNDTYQFLDR